MPKPRSVLLLPGKLLRPLSRQGRKSVLRSFEQAVAVYRPFLRYIDLSHGLNFSGAKTVPPRRNHCQQLSYEERSRARNRGRSLTGNFGEGDPAAARRQKRRLINGSGAELIRFSSKYGAIQGSSSRFFFKKRLRLVLRNRRTAPVRSLTDDSDPLDCLSQIPQLRIWASSVAQVQTGGESAMRGGS
jgi:hypothetical protein